MGQHNSKFKNRQPQPYPLANPAFYPQQGPIYPAAYPHFATGPVVPQQHLITPFPLNYYSQQTRKRKKRRRPSARPNASVAGPSSQPEIQPQAPQATAAAGVPPPPAVHLVPPVANSVPFTPHMEGLANFPRSPMQNPIAVNSRGHTPYPRNPEDDEEEEEDEEEIVVPSRVRGIRTPAPHRRTRSLPRSGDVSRSRTPQVEITAPVNPIAPWPVSNNPLPQPPRDVTQDTPYRQLANLPEVQNIRRSASVAGTSGERERLFRNILANQNPGHITSSQSEASHTQPQTQPSAPYRSRTVAGLFGRKNGGGILRTLNPRRRHAHSNSTNSDGYVDVQPAAQILRSTTPAEPPPPVINYTSSTTSADGVPPPPVLNTTPTPVFASARSVTPGVPGVGTTTPGIATPAVGLTQPPQTTAPPPGQLFEPVQSQQSFTYPNTPATQHVYTRPTTPAAPPNLSATPPIHFSQFSPAPYSGFLNHSPHRVLYQNCTYPTATHLFEALKFLPRRPDLAAKISKTPSVPEVYRLSSTLQKHVRPDWGQVFLSMMEEVLMHKFRQHPDLRNVLLATGATDPTREIVYEDERDRFWGRSQDGQGRNVLGNALKVVRERLRVEFG